MPARAFPGREYREHECEEPRVNKPVNQPASEPIEVYLDAAKKAAPDCEVLVRVSTERSANARFAENEITSCGDADETVLTVLVKRGNRHAQATTNQTDDASVRALAERVNRMARLAPEDPEAMPLLGSQDYPTAAPSFDDPTATLTDAARAKICADAVAVAGLKRLRGAGYIEHAASQTGMATSAGLRAKYTTTRVQLTMTARGEDGGSGWAGAYAERVADIDPAAVAAIACEKAARSAKPRSLDPGRYTVILEPAAVAELLAFLTSALDARVADEGRSAFARKGGGTKVGEKICAESVTLRSDPSDPLTPEAPFDGDGLPLRATTWIDKGVLTNLACSRYWAKKQGRAPLGHGSVWSLGGGAAKDVDALVATVKRGVLVTRFWYTRWVDPQTVLITGLTRDGVFLVEDGKIAHPVNNFRFNESPITMLKNVTAMTPAVRAPTGGVWRVPALVTQEFNLASRSDAI
jgi:predicted Zn-dependent protease